MSKDVYIYKIFISISLSSPMVYSYYFLKHCFWRLITHEHAPCAIRNDAATPPYAWSISYP